jgi:hypothetical protein
MSFLITAPAAGGTAGARQQDLFDSTAPPCAVTGYLRSGLYLGSIPHADGCEYKARYSEGAVKLCLRAGWQGEAVAEFRARVSGNPAGSLPEFTLREAYAGISAGSVDLYLGRRIVSWGKADGYNPTDLITPRNLTLFSPDEDDRRLANYMLQAIYTCPAVQIEAIWIPVYEPSVLPLAGIRPGDGIRLGPPDYPAPVPGNSSTAFRVRYEGASLDGSVSFFSGYAPLPGLAAHTEGDILIVSPRAWDLRMVGADFSTVFASCGVRGEIAWREPAGEDRIQGSIPGAQLEYIFGLDREFGAFSLIVQYLGSCCLDFTPPPSPGGSTGTTPVGTVLLWNRMLSGQLEERTHSLSFRPAWTLLHDTLSLELRARINLSTRESFFGPLLRCDLADNLKLSAGAQLYRGPEGTLFGLLEKSLSAAFIEIKASF